MAIWATEDHDRVAVLTIDSPPVNALSQLVRQAIVDGLADIARTAPEALVIICSGRTFFAGADISEFGRPFEAPDLNDVIEAIEKCPVPVVAAIHGTALGGGLEIALGAHYRVASETASLGLPEVTLGLIPGAGGTQRLPRLIGWQSAAEIITGGKPVAAARARDIGLVDAVVPEKDLLSSAIAFARSRTAPRRTSSMRPPAPTGFSAWRDTQMQGSLLAPKAAAEAMAAVFDRPFEAGLAHERQLFNALLRGSQSRALIHLFFAERAAGRVEGIDARAEPVARVGVIGAGTMGGGIAMALANAGLPVTLVEAREEALDRGIATIRRNYEATARKGRMTAEAVETRMGLISPSLEYSALAEVDLVIEAVFESMSLKEEIFRTLDRVTKPSAILATNTSFLDVDTIAASTSRPERVLGLHFFSPANIMRLLEVVRGARTSPVVLATAMQLAKRMGKLAIVSRVCHGFIANRVMDVRRKQAEGLLVKGATPAMVDGALIDFGFPMGQFAMMDLVGLDVMGRDGSERTVMGDLVAAGRLGQKQGGGYFDYDERRRPRPSGEALAIIETFARDQGMQAAPLPDASQIVSRTLFPVVAECARLLEEGIAQRASDIDAALVAGYGWPAHTGGPLFWADTVGLPTIVAALDDQGAGGETCELLRATAARGGKLHRVGQSDA